MNKQKERAMPKEPDRFVVWWDEHLRDGHEYGSQVVGSINEAMQVMNRLANGFGGSSYSFRLFRLGGEIRLETTTVEEPQPPKTQKKIMAKRPTTSAEACE